MKHTRLLLVLASAAIIWATALAVPSPSTSTYPAASSPATKPALAKLSREAILQQLNEGQFRQAMTALAGLADDESARKAGKLLAEYLRFDDEAAAERHEEFLMARERVRLAGLADQQHAKLAEAKLDEKLHKLVMQLADEISSTEKLLSGNNSASQPSQVQKAALEHLDGATKRIEELLAVVGQEKGDWGTALRGCAEAGQQSLAAWRTLWEKAPVPGWHQMKRAAEKAQDSLIDLGVLVSREPMFVALLHAREARDLAENKEQFSQEPWVKDLIRQAEKRGQEYIDSNRWSDALTLFGHAGLSDLDHDNTAYQDKVKQINQHVRVVNLYGEEQSKTGKATGPQAAIETPSATMPATAPAALPADNTTAASQPEKEEEESSPRWREMIAGIDTKMVRNAISQIDFNYVDNPDYRKIILSALGAIKVLVETPEAAASFPSLKDQPKQQAFLAGLETQLKQARTEDTVDHLNLAMALNRILELNNDTLKLPSEVLDMEFAEGMTGELDQFSTMVWPYEEDDFQKRTMGSFFGIGVQIRKDIGKLLEVVTPLPDTPAFRAGIRAGDYILTIEKNGKPVDTSALAVDQAVKMITGKQHTRVNLTIQRAGVPKPLEMSVERDEIHIQTVKGWRRLDDGKWSFLLDEQSKIAYIRISQFTQDTTTELREALHTISQQEVKGLILDLRFNPGGLLTSAVETADEFLTRGMIVRTKGRNTSEGEKDATAVGNYQSGPLVVLVNKASASAAEILSGALKGWGRATIVGERSYGKGSVQRLIPLKQPRSRLKLTTAYYYIPTTEKPGERCLHRTNGCKVWGVEPDVSVDVTLRQMNRWAELRQETDLLKTVEEQELSIMLAQELREDLQLQAALVLLRAQQLMQPQVLEAKS